VERKKTIREGREKSREKQEKSEREL